MMSRNKIAVLITSFNRREITKRCLDSLSSLGEKLDIYLVDDASTDGTGPLIQSLYPDTNLIQGNGHLYWCGGMRLAWERASLKNYDYYIWLNDDVVVYANAIHEMIECSNLSKNSIITGIIESHDKFEVIYGGSDKHGNLALPSGVMQPIVNLNGNFVLVSKNIFNILGNFDSKFIHDLGDVDYGIRAKKNNITFRAS